ERGQRAGRTLSINWPLWQDGGMHLDPAIQEALFRETGLVPLSRAAGLQTLYQALASDQEQVLVLSGDLRRATRQLLNQPVNLPGAAPEQDGVTPTEIEQTLRHMISRILNVQAEDLDSGIELQEYGFEQIDFIELTTRINHAYRLEMSPSLLFEYSTLGSLARYLAAVNPGRAADALPQTTGPVSEALREQALQYFKQQLAAVLKLPAQRMESHTHLEEYGIDSVKVVQFTSRLEQVFGPLSKTLLFEYPTLRQLTEHFLTTGRAQLARVLQRGEEGKAPTSPDGFSARQQLDFKSQKQPRLAFQQRVVAEQQEQASPAIAIIGVSGRYPGARNLQEFWRNLCQGKDCITEIPPTRWDYRAYFDPDKRGPGKTSSKWGGFLEGVDEFDPFFFHISPREAEMMDPQERLFLQCAYETLEDAGYTRHNADSSMSGRVGVYVGVMYEEYQLYGVQEQAQGRPLALGGSPSSIANRVSYFCNFHGPSLAIDTMCSSSLTALHLACQSIQRGECDLALAGGVNLSLHPNKYLVLGQNNFVSSKGRCESFGEGGDGYVPGEGVGAVLLKPLEQAIADRDHIYGIVKGSAINHGGKTNGYTVPNPVLQADVTNEALRAAKIDPRVVSYLEAHGTGTSLGDPIEIAGLTRAFRAFTDEKQYCALGSVKSNIGHCESAAGIAGITKILLQMKYRQLVPSLHARVLNPHIDFASTPFFVQQEQAEWRQPVVDGRVYPRIAGISSFGAGGTNVHIVLEEYIPEPQHASRVPVFSPKPALIVLSARNKMQLRQQAEQLLVALREWNFVEEDLASIAYTLQVGREAQEERVAMIAHSLGELEAGLQSYLASQEAGENVYTGQVQTNRDTLEFFTRDEEILQTIDTWIAKGKYDRLLKLWVDGIDVDWHRLYGDARPSRISLPTYPFARVRYWIPGTGASVMKSAQNEAATAQENAPEQATVVAAPVLPGSALEVPDKPGAISLLPLSTLVPLTTQSQKDVQVSITLGNGNGAGHPVEEVPASRKETASHTAAHIETADRLITLREELRASLAQALYADLSDIDPRKKFIDLGMDSIIGVEWINALNKRYGLNLLATAIYDHPTIDAFAPFLHSELKQRGDLSLVAFAETPEPVDLHSSAPPEELLPMQL
ncbi:MAG TPA: beta-ketoacyl synthase N-terminal-like domain-containing protein, partial [Ktedonobacteraceae bacterium]|nr:beta-ketoacyl synthase N-terminal-like domain-containing protein [Ktedonobacteraceae bacterium]